MSAPYYNLAFGLSIISAALLKENLRLPVPTATVKRSLGLLCAAATATSLRHRGETSWSPVRPRRTTRHLRPFRVRGGTDPLRQDPRPSSGSGGVSERIVIDPEAVLESFRISESGPALAGPAPTPPTSTPTSPASPRPMHGQCTAMIRILGP